MTVQPAPIGQHTLADVSTSAAAAVGVAGFTDSLGLGPARQVIVCLIDGLGWQSLQEHRHLAPHLVGLAGSSVQAPFPSTTPVGLATLGTGLLAGQHGLVGASFEYPETGELLSPLQWGHHPTPVAVQPEPTVFERVHRAGIRMTSLSPQAYAQSGLTRAVLRGADYRGVDDVDQRCEGVAEILRGDEPSYTYLYWPELDRVGHEAGVQSAEWRAALARVDSFVERLVSLLVPGSLLLVTSDHGMVDIPDDHRIHLDDDARLRLGVRRWAGEPRARHVYAEPGAEADVLSTWRQVLDPRADVMSRVEAIDRGLFGPMDPSLADRLGDVIAVPRDRWMLASAADPTVSRLRGQHGGLTPEEILIPALTVRSGM